MVYGERRNNSYAPTETELPNVPNEVRLFRMFDFVARKDDQPCDFPLQIGRDLQAFVNRRIYEDILGDTPAPGGMQIDRETGGTFGTGTGEG